MVKLFYSCWRYCILDPALMLLSFKMIDEPQICFVFVVESVWVWTAQSLVSCLQPVSSRRRVLHQWSMSEMAPRRSRGEQRGLLLGSERPSKRSSPRSFPSQSMFLTSGCDLHKTIVGSYWTISVFLRPYYNADSNLRGRGGASGRRAGNARIPDNWNIRGKREYDRHNGTWVFCASVFVLSRIIVCFSLLQSV